MYLFCHFILMWFSKLSVINVSGIKEKERPDVGVGDAPTGMLSKGNLCRIRNWNFLVHPGFHWSQTRVKKRGKRYVVDVEMKSRHRLWVWVTIDNYDNLKCKKYKHQISLCLFTYTHQKLLWIKKLIGNSQWYGTSNYNFTYFSQTSICASF